MPMVLIRSSSLTHCERWFTHGPVWSPGSTKLAFTAVTENNFEIHVINADGSGQINPTNHPADDILPAWSPGR